MLSRFHPPIRRINVTKEYDELVEVVAKALGDVLPTHDFKDEAKTAIRAIQDWMPHFNSSMQDGFMCCYQKYYNLKTLGRNDENN